MHLTLTERIDILAELGRRLQSPDDYLDAVIHRTSHHNLWFTKENQRKAIDAIASKMLQPGKLRHWLESYNLPSGSKTPVVGMVMAGNLPLVGWHDVQCVFAAGCKSQIKLSEKDPYLLPCLLRMLGQIDPRCNDFFEIVPRLKGFDAVIATGSNNTSRYFETYFAGWPHIIRRNRNAVAILDGKESAAELKALGEDIFTYFGLGCRNVAKIYVPLNYDFQPLLEMLHEFRHVVLHDKYKNNFDYNYALYALNKTPFYMSGSILLTENAGFHSRIAALHYEYYAHPASLETILRNHHEEIQCIVGHKGLLSKLPVIPFGKAQEPGLTDYADGVDTMAFLKNEVLK